MYFPIVDTYPCRDGAGLKTDLATETLCCMPRLRSKLRAVYFTDFAVMARTVWWISTAGHVRILAGISIACPN